MKRRARVPAYLSPAQIADAVGLSRGAVITELRNASVLEKRGTRYRVSRSMLRERLPDYFDDVFEHFVSQHEEDEARSA